MFNFGINRVYKSDLVMVDYNWPKRAFKRGCMEDNLTWDVWKCIMRDRNPRDHLNRYLVAYPDIPATATPSEPIDLSGDDWI